MKRSSKSSPAKGSPRRKRAPTAGVKVYLALQQKTGEQLGYLLYSSRPIGFVCERRPEAFALAKRVAAFIAERTRCRSQYGGRSASLRR